MGQVGPGALHRQAEGRAVTDCVFCPANWPNLDVVERTSKVVIIRPLEPVTPGHVLAIHREHTQNAADRPRIAAETFKDAAYYVAARPGLQANIITSIGPHATQTVFHTHVHVVPRRENDGLPLPWTPQHELKRLHAIMAMKNIAQESSLHDISSVGIFQQQSSPYTLSSFFPQQSGPYAPQPSPKKEQKPKPHWSGLEGGFAEGIAVDD